ncbi:threo-3-hydroxy-L-aspartate ammonia-lyase [Idiomarina seosinensis]|uniref:threo-3-hydroxy-L-aspartate ammonia-lyase n=1 Tax=Idiomarina seosinensis TaxID=281739 RepID=UPI00385003DA
MTISLPTYKDVEAAAGRIQPYVKKTPVYTSTTANEMFSAELFFKCENFQRMGAFKFRGAMNALLQFNDQQKAAGVIAYSSGNHAQAIALAAKLLEIKATIVMPEDAPEAKVDATRSYGADIIRYNRYQEDRRQIGQQLAEQYGYTLIPPYDHPQVLSGQGTTAKELFEQVKGLDTLLVCLGGGGLLSGCALAARHFNPGCKIYGVEPEAGNDGQQSFQQGKIVRIETPETIADGAQTQYLGDYTFPIIRDTVDDILTVTDNQLIEAMAFFAERMKMVVEPTGCLGFAAAHQLKPELYGKRVGIIISGGNVDLERYAQLLLKNEDLKG